MASIQAIEQPDMRKTAPTQSPQSDAPMVSVSGLVKRYGRFTAVSGISLAIRRGEIFGLLGPNGAGKTTTLEIIEGIRLADEGTVIVDGLNVRKQRRVVQQRIGVQLQATTLFPDLTVREIINLFGAFYPHAVSADDLLSEVALTEKARAYPQDLSGGQRQRLALALALVNDPTLVFLDEPTTGLDPQSRHMLWESVLRLRERGKTVVLTTHFMDEAQTLCDRIAIMDHGAIIAQDTPAGLIATLGASAAIECAFTEYGRPSSTITAVELRTLPGVTDARDGVKRTLIYTRNVEQTLVALLQYAAVRGVMVDHLQVNTPTLEDVFLKLTGRGLRD
ncbi:MAG TPA: ABC transporter ATP-binding protein [Ktedonobacterales bacterium]|nr:ABC transporter ATP-binding protein [Ktedonobacterales bacterium]